MELHFGAMKLIVYGFQIAKMGDKNYVWSRTKSIL